MSTEDDVDEAIQAFVAARSWSVFHTPKNLAMAVSAEAGELLAEFQWLSPEESQEAAQPGDLRDRVALEIADVAIYLRLLAAALRIDIDDAIRRKIDLNEVRFPVGGHASGPGGTDTGR